MTITSEQIEQLKAANPGRDLYLVTQEHAGQVVIRVPTLEEYQRFLDELVDPETKAKAARALVFTSVICPAEAEFRAIVQRRPGVIQSLADEIVEHAGLKRVTERKKL